MDRRDLLKCSALLAGAPALAPLGALAAKPASRGGATPETGTAPLETALHWLDGAAPASFAGTTFGVPWPLGRAPKGSAFVLRPADGTGIAPSQSWPLAFWPDGSIKWSAHAVGPGAGPDSTAVASAYQVFPIGPEALAGSTQSVTHLVTRVDGAIVVDTGRLRARVPLTGDTLFTSLALDGRTALRDGALVLLTEGVTDDEAASAQRLRWRGAVEKVEVEQDGPVRAVLKLTGAHRAPDGAKLLPFTLRLEFYRGSDAVRVLHTFLYDADPLKVHVRGLGVRFGVALDGAPHDRHVRFVADAGGVFAESVRSITGLRRDPGEAIAAAQVAGRPLPPVAAWPQNVRDGLPYVPAFGDYRLLQPNADGFTITKRTSSGHGWIASNGGTRAAGTGYVGGTTGGVAFGVRHFWQSHPGQLDIVGAAGDQTSVTLWLWAPSAPAMDLRFYHDGMGQDTFEKQRAALDITYEDYQPDYGTPYGVGRTSELALQLLPATPTPAELAAIARRIEGPPRLLPSPARIHAAGVFSDYWAPAGQGGARAKPYEQRLGKLFDHYRGQVEQRRWYGFWDYGDVMHTYDPRRHQWRYDVGGFAWDNSELSTDIWLWHYFLHSGRADAFRFAEAMTRHTGEVDVYHIGPFSPLGTRHGVQHWADSAKQARISTAINRRFMYYLTADERIGDLLTEQLDAVARLQDIVPGRKIGAKGAEAPGTALVGFGTDWGAVAGAWFTAWERTGDKIWRDRLLASMASIAAQPHGFFTGSAIMDLQTGRFAIDTKREANASHLSAVFGLTEICSELLRTLPEPAFRAAWLQYCRLYNADGATQKTELGRDLGKLNLSQGHARLLGYLAAQTRDPQLMKQAWQQFEEGKAGLKDADFAVHRVRAPAVLNDIDEAARLSTNSAAQWGLGALGLLALEAQAAPPGPVLFLDDFRTFDRRRWRVEAEAGNAASAATVRDGALVLDAPAGLTVWFTEPLSGHYEIGFTRTVPVTGTAGERLSDLNVFWQAKPTGAVSGKLADYDEIPMFYAGIGGNTNTTSRFRHYDGSGKRILLQEYLAAPWLLQANQPYRVRIVVDGGGTRLHVDNVLYFASPERLGPGLFGLRTTLSRQRVSDFIVHRLP